MYFRNDACFNTVFNPVDTFLTLNIATKEADVRGTLDVYNGLTKKLFEQNHETLNWHLLPFNRCIISLH